MKLVINNKELEPIIKTVNEDTSNLNNQLNNLLAQINELRKIWQGNDSEIFCNNATEYIKYLQSIPQIYNALCQTMNNASLNYSRIDKECAQAMRKAVAKHEQ